jgi:hypothetical protein
VNDIFIVSGMWYISKDTIEHIAYSTLLGIKLKYSIKTFFNSHFFDIPALRIHDVSLNSTHKYVLFELNESIFVRFSTTLVVHQRRIIPLSHISNKMTRRSVLFVRNQLLITIGKHLRSSRLSWWYPCCSSV